jgi:hypothetical protein
VVTGLLAAAFTLLSSGTIESDFSRYLYSKTKKCFVETKVIESNSQEGNEEEAVAAYYFYDSHPETKDKENVVIKANIAVNEISMKFGTWKYEEDKVIGLFDSQRIVTYTEEDEPQVSNSRIEEESVEIIYNKEATEFKYRIAGSPSPLYPLSEEDCEDPTDYNRE